jgi:predicted Zn-dependent peptidase
MITGELLKDGGAGPWSSRQLVHFVESLGASLEIWTGPDATRLTLGVATEHLEPAFDILAAVAHRPRLVHEEFRKLADRQIERVQSLARTSGRWAARMALYRRLYSLPTGLHPYAAYDATAADLRGIRLRDCRAWHRRHFTPKNSLLIAAGAVSPDVVLSNARRVFGGWRGDPPERTPFGTPLPPPHLEIRVVDRPGSAQSDILVGLLGAPRVSTDWLPLKTSAQVLGGRTAGRLFLDVRERRSLAYSTGASVGERAQGPVPIVLSASTRTEMTTSAVSALLEHVDRLGREALLDTEVRSATRYLADSLLVRLETVESVADLVADAAILQLGDNYYEDYRAALRTLDAGTLHSVAGRYFSSDRAHVVVTGEADRIAKGLARFAAVKVVDPEHGFVVKRTIARDPTGQSAGASPSTHAE